MKPWKRRLLLPVVALGITWLCTGGLVVHSYWVLPFNSYDRDFKPYILVEVKCPSVTCGVPFVYQHFGDRPPFGLSLLYITHNVVEDPKITFDTFALRFP